MRISLSGSMQWSITRCPSTVSVPSSTPRRSRTMRITSPIASLGVMMRALMIGSEIDSYALGSGIWSGLSRSFTVPSFIFTL